MEPTASQQRRTEAAPSGLVVVGASAGGVGALLLLASTLPTTFPWPILVVLHIGGHRSLLPQLLSSRGLLPAAHAQHGERLAGGHIYVAPPDHHLLVEDGHIRLTKGPKEHFTRPAIDPLFLSAALNYGPAAVGVVLTGTLEDGTAGLQAIKQCGGIAVVQDPRDAVEPEMPRSALRHVAVDHCAPVAALAEVLVRLATGPALAAAPHPAPARLLHEQALTAAQGDPLEHLAAIAEPSTFVCPDCQGSLWRLNEGRPVRFRCHTGHAYTLKTLRAAYTETSDSALWTAVRALQEQGALLAALSHAQREAGEHEEAAQIEATREALLLQLHKLRELVEKRPDTS